MKRIFVTLIMTPLALVFVACQPTTAPPGGQSAASSAAQNPATSVVSSATNQTLTAAEVGAIYQDLATKGMDIDNDFSGYTTPNGTPVTVNGATYYPFPKYASVEAMKAAVEVVFTPGFAQQTYDDAFTQAGPDQPARFIDYNGALYKLDSGGWGGEGSAILGTIQITNQTADTITFTAKVQVETGEIVSADFRLVNVRGSWRLDCPVPGYQIDTGA